MDRNLVCVVLRGIERGLLHIKVRKNKGPETRYIHSWRRLRLVARSGGLMIPVILPRLSTDSRILTGYHRASLNVSRLTRVRGRCGGL